MLNTGWDVGMLVVIFMAIAIGYWLGRRASRKLDIEEPSHLEPHYIKGLNYLLNEQPDAAIDTFIDALEVNSETLETHLALGNLLRKRGEVGRAIKIHQNLLARPGLPDYHAQQVQLELARDYIKSGLLDRAETLLQEMVPVAAADIRTACLRHLIEIYRDEKEWLRAIEAVNQLAGRRFGRLPEEWRVAQGHFYCEVAEQAVQRGDYLAARRHLKAALNVDRGAIRANLLLGELELQQGSVRDAIRALKQVPQQNPDYIPQALPLLVQAYTQQGRQDSLKRYLLELQQGYQGTSVALALSDLLAVEEGGESATGYMAQRLNSRPSLPGLGHLLKYKAQQESGTASESLQLTLSLINKLNEAKPGYRCTKCGFSGHQLHWLCPSCKSWGTVKTIKGVEGE
ncbi:lipopolysaccharide assembly protein LapB [Maricurvus nonylphenolicus]|uniref:lipopolysaccharide assembly protein LapB n=1 Tax=Maricurvus nonylphenolicus TaxID=1008307 RepID=UPI0036F2BA2F